MSIQSFFFWIWTEEFWFWFIGKLEEKAKIYIVFRRFFPLNHPLSPRIYQPAHNAVRLGWDKLKIDTVHAVKKVLYLTEKLKNPTFRGKL